VLNQIEPATGCSLDDFSEVEIARQVVHGAIQIGAKIFSSPNDLLSNNAKLKIAFAAQLFNARNGLPPLDPNLLKATNEAISKSRSSKEYAINASALSEVDSIFPSKQAVVVVRKEAHDLHSTADSDDESDFSSQTCNNSYISNWGTPQKISPVTPANKYLSGDNCYLRGNSENDSKASNVSGPYGGSPMNALSPILSTGRASNHDLEETKDSIDSNIFDTGRGAISTYRSGLSIEVEDSDDESNLSQDWRDAVGSPPINMSVDSCDESDESELTDHIFGISASARYQFKKNASFSKLRHYWAYVPILGSMPKDWIDYLFELLFRLVTLVWQLDVFLYHMAKKAAWWVVWGQFKMWYAIIWSLAELSIDFLRSCLSIPRYAVATSSKLLLSALSFVTWACFGGEMELVAKKRN
jgi:hypothetical protein